MNKEQKEFLKKELRDNESYIIYRCLEDFLLDSEGIKAIYDYYGPEKEVGFRESIAYILTKKRLITFEIKKDFTTIKQHYLKDIYSFEVKRLTEIPRPKIAKESKSPRDPDLIESITMNLRNKEDKIEIEFNDNPIYGISIQKEKAFKFIKALNKLLNS